MFFVAFAPALFLACGFLKAALSVRHQPLWTGYSLEPVVVSLDKLLNFATSDLKSVELYLNKRYGKSEKVKVGHRVKLKDFSGKRLWLHQDPRRARRRRTPMVWL